MSNKYQLAPQRQILNFHPDFKNKKQLTSYTKEENNWICQNMTIDKFISFGAHILRISIICKENSYHGPE